ncbi:MAG: cytochrome P450 [Acetobacteraceae bacterium]
MPALLVPPRPPVSARELPLRAFLRATRTNALTMWPQAAYEEPARVGKFFGRTSVLLNAPAAIHRVLVDNPENYRRSPASIRILRPLTGNGLLLSEGEDWRLQRRTIAPALAPRVLPMLARHIVAVADETVAALRTQTAAPIALFPIIQRTALEIAGRSMFSLEMRDFGAGLRALIAEFGMTHARPRLPDLILPPAIPTFGDIGRRLFQRRWMGFISTIMRAREAIPPSEDARDLFDPLRAARDPETGRGFTHEQLRDQIATMILAGHETTGVTIFWALTLLAHAPDAQARVAEEVRGLDLSTIPDLVFTRSVVSETLRLYPPAFTLARMAKSADQAGDVAIPRGAVILIAPWVLHRHRKLWRDPDAFDPTRFLPGAEPPPRFAYLPFGAGPRVCVGAQFALTEATLVLGAFIDAFEITLDGPRPVLPVAVVTTQPDHSPEFRLRPRRPATGAAPCPSSTPSAATTPT